ncbi:MAG: hypothetical protein PHT55_04280, partial [Spirochaetales bacterium]|nr:hypothetical protein [Spirochaetales bacterium]
ATKLDLPEALERYEEFKALNPAEEVLGISVFSGQGLAELKDSIFRQVAAEETRLTEAAQAAEELLPGEENHEPAGGEDPFDMSDEDLLG